MELEPEVQEFLDSKLAEQKAEMDKKIDSLANKNKEILDEKKKLQQKYSNVPDDFDFESIKKLQNHLESSEEARLLAEGKIDEVIQKRTEKARIDMEQKINEINGNFESVSAERDAIKGEFNQYRIQLAVDREAQKAGVRPEALDDVIGRAAGMFQLDEDGSIISRDQDGMIRKFDDGTPITPETFVKNLKKSAPHFWPESAGAGLRGGQGGSDDIADDLSKAASSGDLASYRKLRKNQK